MDKRGQQILGSLNTPLCLIPVPDLLTTDEICPWIALVFHLFQHPLLTESLYAFSLHKHFLSNNYDYAVLHEGMLGSAPAQEV